MSVEDCLSSNLTSQLGCDPSSMGHIMLDPRETSPKKKTKLGYHRQSVACSHCRRRKIRCLRSDYMEKKCENCARTGKECHFLTVSEDSAVVGLKRSKAHLGTRTKSFNESRMEYGMSTSSYVDSSYSSPTYSNTEDPRVVAQMQPYELAGQYHELQEYDFVPQQQPQQQQSYRKPHTGRPPLVHRRTDPSYYPHLQDDNLSREGYDVNYGVPQYRSPTMHCTQAPSPDDSLNLMESSAPWPIYAQHSASTLETTKFIPHTPVMDEMQPLDAYHAQGMQPQSTWSRASTLGNESAPMYIQQQQHHHETSSSPRTPHGMASYTPQPRSLPYHYREANYGTQFRQDRNDQWIDHKFTAFG